jgi:hypothetical protein
MSRGFARKDAIPHHGSQERPAPDNLDRIGQTSYIDQV